MIDQESTKTLIYSQINSNVSENKGMIKMINEDKKHIGLYLLKAVAKTKEYYLYKIIINEDGNISNIVNKVKYD